MCQSVRECPTSWTQFGHLFVPHSYLDWRIESPRGSRTWTSPGGACCHRPRRRRRPRCSCRGGTCRTCSPSPSPGGASGGCQRSGSTPAQSPTGPRPGRWRAGAQFNRHFPVPKSVPDLFSSLVCSLETRGLNLECPSRLKLGYKLPFLPLENCVYKGYSMIV